MVRGVRHTVKMRAPMGGLPVASVRVAIRNRCKGGVPCMGGCGRGYNWKKIKLSCHCPPSTRHRILAFVGNFAAKAAFLSAEGHLPMRYFHVRLWELRAITVNVVDKNLHI